MTVKTGTIIETNGDYSNIRLDNESILNNIKNNGHSNGAEVIIDYDETNTPHILNSPNNSFPSQEVIDSIISTVEARLLERDHPVGSPYFTFIVSDNPNNRFPGTTWERIEENTYLVSAGDGINALDKVGSNTHTLTNNQMPKHRHAIAFASRDANDSGVTDIEENQWHFIGNPSGMWPSNWGIRLINSGRVSINSRYQGNSEPHNNMPKSVAIYMWRRIA